MKFVVQHCLSAASSWHESAYPGSVTSGVVPLPGVACAVEFIVAFWGDILLSGVGALF